MSPSHKPLVWLHEQPQTPPLSQKARVETKTSKTPDEILELCRQRLKTYDAED